ncbi:MAG: NAD-dependent epimerase/dehydratase family protein [Chloroflexi bacterium]|nr:NAD-dependent epimerase/dehydratase family protein [Chloroflexota bacterium]
MTTLVVGGTGFLGSAVVPRLPDAEVLVRPTSDRRWLPRETVVRVADLDDPARVRPALAGVDRLVWCASMGFGQVPTLVPMLEDLGVRRAVFLSSTAIFTSLPAPSRGVRLAAEGAVRASTLDWTLLRPTMIYGSGRDRNISRLLRVLRRAPFFPIVGGGRGLHQPIYVEDLAEAVVAALASPATSRQAYNLGGAQPITFVDLVRQASAALGRRVPLVHVPAAAALAAARLVPAGPVSPEQLRRLSEDKAFDTAPAQHAFGFAPRPFVRGVQLEAAALGLAPPR